MTREAINVRSAQAKAIGPLAALWFEGWHDAHANILPAEIAKYRTLESLSSRLRTLIASTRIAGPRNAPAGFCITQADELYQLYVGTQSRGKGIAAALLSDAKECFSARSLTVAWLACAMETSVLRSFTRSLMASRWYDALSA